MGLAGESGEGATGWKALPPRSILISVRTLFDEALVVEDGDCVHHQQYRFYERAQHFVNYFKHNYQNRKIELYSVINSNTSYLVTSP